ncbi:MAG TPA: ATP-binding protein [Oculatellaceae cyanobacterium]|jgi:signal transduction histidine kinase
MKLRQKLLSTFSGLALLALVTAGVTGWSTLKWQGSNEQLQRHYQRSLLLQRVRAAVFRAFKEVPDAVTGDDPNSREEFDQYLAPAEADFQRWAALADTDAEKQQVQQVRNAYNQLIKEARTAFKLVEAGRRKEATVLMEGKLEDKNFVDFQKFTDQAVESDRNYRQVVSNQVRNTRETAQLVLAIASFGTISLILLLAAYLAADLFAPLREIEQALDDVAKGDLQRRLDAERSDEIGAINKAFNNMLEAMREREQYLGLTAVPVNANDSNDGVTLENMPSRLMLHQLVSQLRSRVTQLHSDNESNGNGATAVQQKQDLIAQLDDLLQAVSRITEFGFPLDLNLARTDIRALLYEVLLRFHDQLVQSGVSFELDIAPEVNQAVVDKLKLREALAELIRNAINALPEQGGRLGIRASIADEGTQLIIEVADNGKGIEQPLINQAFASLDSVRVATPQEYRTQPTVGLKLTKAIVEQHGGHLIINSQPNQGTYVQMQLPLRNQ